MSTISANDSARALSVSLAFLTVVACSDVVTVSPADLQCPPGQIPMDGICVDEPQPDASVPEPLSVELTDGLVSYLDFDPDKNDYTVEVRHLLPELTLRVSPADQVEVLWKSQELGLEDDGEAVLEFNPGASDLLRITDEEGEVYQVSIERDAATEFEQDAYAKAPVASQAELFGAAVAASGDVVVVGGSSERVVVFRRIGETWARETEIGAPSQSPSRFGRSVAIHDDTLVVGAQGAAYVFVFDDGSWEQEDVLRPTSNDSSFGVAVDVRGDTAVVGVSEDDGEFSDSGAAYVFTRAAEDWSEQGVLKASNAGRSDRFGGAVAIYDSTIIVGALGEDSDATGVDGDQGDNLETASESGAAYLFEWDGSDWSQVAYLKAPEVIPSGAFGDSVDVYEGTAVVGATFGDDGHGEAHVFSRSGSSWSFAATLKSPNPEDGDFFGETVAIDRINIVISAGGEDSSERGVLPPDDIYDNDVEGSGAAYVFVNGTGGWSPRFYLKALNAGPNDYFGGEPGRQHLSVAISGDTVVVGAPGEDSNAIDIGGDGGDDSVSNSGAAYIFR